MSSFETEKSLGLALAKRSLSFSKATDLFSTRVSAIENEVRVKREYFRNLERIAQRHKIVVPHHGTITLSTLKPEELIAVEFSPSHLVYLHRSLATLEGMVVSLQEEEAHHPLQEDFKVK
jgi:hypothetical protein